MLRDTRVFLGQFFRRYHTTGSFLPSSRSLARVLCRYVAPPGRPSAAPRDILEVGPGTGAVTACIVRQLRSQDRLTLVEINPEFVRHLEQRFATEPEFAAAGQHTHIIHAPLEDLPADARYDLVISGLPLNNFAVAEVERILDSFQRLLKPGGILSFFEYIAIRSAKALVSGSQGRARLRGIAAALRRTLDGREIRRDWVWTNVPPAWVHHVRFTAVEMPDV